MKYQFLLENNKPLNMLTKLKFLILYGIYNLGKYNPEDVVLNLQMLYYDSKISLLKNEIETIKNTLQRDNFEQIMQEYTDVSMKLLKTELCKNTVKTLKGLYFKKGIINENLLSLSKSIRLFLVPHIRLDIAPMKITCLIMLLLTRLHRSI